MKAFSGSLVFASLSLSILLEYGHAVNLRSIDTEQVTPEASVHHRILQQDEEGYILVRKLDYAGSTLDENGISTHEPVNARRPQTTLNIELAGGFIYEITNAANNWDNESDNVDASLDIGKEYAYGDANEDSGNENDLLIGNILGMVQSGITKIKIKAGATISGGTIDLHGSKPEIIDNGTGNNRSLRNVADPAHRHLATTFGDKTILAVKVIAADGKYSYSERKLSDSVFSTYGDPVSLKSQYAECSYDQIHFNTAPDRKGISTKISKGVVTITLKDTFTTDGDYVMSNAITSELNSQFGVSSPDQLADYVMYCLPYGTMYGIAYAYIYSWNSVYSDSWCNYVSGQMHEIGHNLGFAHSGEYDIYDDQTGMMGYSYYGDDWPKMCFNVAKSYQSGWYSAGTITIDPANGEFYDGVLYGIADFGGIDVARTVILKINDFWSEDFYVAFNRQTGINADTQEAWDQVTVVKAGGEGLFYYESDLMAKLNSGENYTISELFTGSDGNYLTIVVNSIDTSASPGFAHVSIGYCMGKPKARCEEMGQCRWPKSSKRCVPAPSPTAKSAKSSKSAKKATTTVTSKSKRDH